MTVSPYTHQNYQYKLQFRKTLGLIFIGYVFIITAVQNV